jgi:hypothetical protein
MMTGIVALAAMVALMGLSSCFRTGISVRFATAESIYATILYGVLTAPRRHRTPCLITTPAWGKTGKATNTPTIRRKTRPEVYKGPDQTDSAN